MRSHPPLICNENAGAVMFHFWHGIVSPPLTVSLSGSDSERWRALTQTHSQGSGHLLEVVSAGGIKDGAALEQLQGLLDFTLQTQDQRCAASDDFYMRKKKVAGRRLKSKATQREVRAAGRSWIMYRPSSLTPFGLPARQRGLTLNIYGIFTHPIGLLQLLLDDGLQGRKVGEAKCNQSADKWKTNTLWILIHGVHKMRHFFLLAQVLPSWMRHI